MPVIFFFYASNYLLWTLYFWHRLTLACAEDMRIAKCVRWLQEHEVCVAFTRVRVQPSKLQCPIMLWEYSQNAHLVSSRAGSISFMNKKNYFSTLNLNYTHTHNYFKLINKSVKLHLCVFESEGHIFQSKCLWVTDGCCYYWRINSNFARCCIARVIGHTRVISRL